MVHRRYILVDEYVVKCFQQSALELRRKQSICQFVGVIANWDDVEALPQVTDYKRTLHQNQDTIDRKKLINAPIK